MTSNERGELYRKIAHHWYSISVLAQKLGAESEETAKGCMEYAIPSQIASNPPDFLPGGQPCLT